MLLLLPFFLNFILLFFIIIIFITIYFIIFPESQNQSYKREAIYIDDGGEGEEPRVKQEIWKIARGIFRMMKSFADLNLQLVGLNCI